MTADLTAEQALEELRAKVEGEPRMGAVVSSIEALEAAWQRTDAAMDEAEARLRSVRAVLDRVRPSDAQPEPVAWASIEASGEVAAFSTNRVGREDAEAWASERGYSVIPLYSHPPVERPALDREALIAAVEQAIGCEKSTERPECKWCGDGYCSPHPEETYCDTHDQLTEQVDGPCRVAEEIADAVLALLASPSPEPEPELRRCEVCKDLVTDAVGYVEHVRLGVVVCSTCPKTDVCGEDISAHTVVWHSSAPSAPTEAVEALLREAFEDYLHEHDSWRCAHPDRYPHEPDCPCGLVGFRERIAAALSERSKP